MFAFISEILSFHNFLLLITFYFPQSLFNVCCKAGLVVMNSFELCFSVKLLLPCLEGAALYRNVHHIDCMYLVALGA